jgi:GGDEF domain-containing protein
VATRKGRADETDPVKLEYQLKSMTNNLGKERQNDDCLPTVAYGYSIFKGGKGIGFKEVLNEADEQMYYFKKLQKNIQKCTQTP